MVINMAEKLFIFDLDGTLIENDAFYYVLEELKKLFKASIDSEVIYETFHDVYRSFVIKGDLRKAFDWDLITYKTLEKLGLKPVQKNIFHRIFINYVNEFPPRIRSGVITFLRHLRVNGFKSAILTNGRKKYQSLILRKLGLSKYLDFILTNDDVPRAKPFKEAYEYVIKISRVENLDNVYYVGDHIFYDLYGAVKASIPNVFYLSNSIKRGEYKIRDIKKTLINFTKDRYCIDISESLTDILNKRFIVINNFSELIELVRID